MNTYEIPRGTSLNGCLLALIVFLNIAGVAMAADFFVSPQGNDGWTGRLAAPNATQNDGPFASLERARDEIRQMKADNGRLSEPATVWIRGGTYYFTNTFTLNSLDSGTPETPVIYRNYKNEHPIFEGAKPVVDFKVYKGHILKADLSHQGLAGKYFRQLYFNGRRQPLARYPNYDSQDPIGGGWAYVSGNWHPMFAPIRGENLTNRHLLTMKATDFHHWSKPKEGNVIVFPRYNWWNNIMPIASVDEQTHTLKLIDNCSYEIRPGDRYYVENLFEELDSPGEWYLDRSTWTLYFWPPTSLGDKPVLAAVAGTLVNFTNGAANVTLRGITLEDCVGSAVTMCQATNCLVAGCCIRNVGSYFIDGIHIEGGLHDGVVGCDLSQIGRSAIYLQGGDQTNLISANHYVDNNCISYPGVDYKQGVGLEIRGVGNRASHNLIHNTPRMGILFFGNLHVIEFNEVHHANLETQDTGIIYTDGRNWLNSRGCIIRYNYLHDSIGYGQNADGQWVAPNYCVGIYLDDYTAGVDVIGNIIARCQAKLIYLHNGRDNVIENNILVNGGNGPEVDYCGGLVGEGEWNRFLPAMTNTYNSVASQPKWQKMRGFNIGPLAAPLADGTSMAGNIFRRNIIFYASQPAAGFALSDLTLAHLRMHISSAPEAKLWTLENVSFDHFLSDSNLIWHDGGPLVISRQRIGDDSYGKMETYSWATWQQLGFDQHSLVSDPLFVNAGRDDYRLQPGSPAKEIGFQPIPVEKIGPYKSPLRASWPIGGNN